MREQTCLVNHPETHDQVQFQDWEQAVITALVVLRSHFP